MPVHVVFPLVKKNEAKDTVLLRQRQRQRQPQRQQLPPQEVTAVRASCRMYQYAGHRVP